MLVSHTLQLYIQWNIRNTDCINVSVWSYVTVGTMDKCCDTVKQDIFMRCKFC